MTPSGCATPLIGGGTPVGLAFGRPRTSSSDAGRRDDEEEEEDSESEDEDEEESGRRRMDSDGRQVTMAQTDRFGFFVGSDQYSGNVELVKKVV